jgi:hypothetical protein
VPPAGVLTADVNEIATGAVELRTTKTSVVLEDRVTVAGVAVIVCWAVKGELA